jgi:hypothetical protein
MRECPGSLFVAGQKARVLRRSCRDNVIAAMQEHDICYHGSYTSDYPEPALVYGVSDNWDTALARAQIWDCDKITGRTRIQLRQWHNYE